MRDRARASAATRPATQVFGLTFFGNGSNYAEDPPEESEPEEEDNFDTGELVTATVQDDVYGAAFVLTIRGLQERKLGTILTAWFWVSTAVALSLFIMFNLHFYINLENAAEFGGATMAETLHRALAEDLPLNQTTKRDRRIMSFCQKLPSLLFFGTVQFIWTARMIGQFSQARAFMSLLFGCPIQETRSMTVYEKDGAIIITGLLAFDALFFSVTLVAAKTGVAVLLWYTGTELLAVTSDVTHLLFKAITLSYITDIERQVFKNFLAQSKQEWIRRTQVVQERGQILRFMISWPGEVLKLLSAVVLVVLANLIFRSEFELRSLCWTCIHNCYTACSKSFDYCSMTNAALHGIGLG